MGFKTPNQPFVPKLTGIPIQTASSLLPVPISYGLSRASGNLLDYVDFTAKKIGSKGGKGFGAQGSGYDYHATVLIGLSEGPITGVAKAWDTNGAETTVSALGFTLFLGAMPQSPWGTMVSAHPDHADGYPGVAYVAHANLDLGSSGTVPNFNWEIQGELYNTAAAGAGDADPALMVQDLLTNADHGVGVAAGFLDLAALLSGPDAATTGDSAFQTYCAALGVGFSITLATQEQAAAIIKRWCDLAVTAPVWTGFSLKLVPYADTTVTGNGVTFLPPTASVFALGDDDYLQDAEKDPVAAARADPTQTPNCASLNIRDRTNDYNQVPVDWQDDNAIALYGVVAAGASSADEICVLSMGNAAVSLIGQRAAFVRNSYTFVVGPRWDLLEPMDVGTVLDPVLGLLTVRITEIDEDDKDQLTIIAEEFTGALGSIVGQMAAAGVTPTVVDSLADPGPVNPPILIEPPSTLAQALFGSTAAVVAAAVSGGDGTTAEPLWGGAMVWVSTDDVTYSQIGEISGPARQGVATADLAAYGGANPDTVDTLSVTLLQSAGALTGVDAANAAAGVTLAWLDGEYLSFRDATLTGPSAYDLGGQLYRGLYGSTPGAHLSGAAFARLDDKIFHFALPAAYVGVPLWFKFQSFNIWGKALQDLSTCTAYTLTPAGTGFGGGMGGVPTAPTGLTPATVDPQAVGLSWAANPATDNVTAYQVWRAAGSGAAFGSASLVATVTGLTWTDAGLTASTVYSYFLVAVNAVGASAPTAEADGTSGTAGAAGGGGVVSTTESADFTTSAAFNCYFVDTAAGPITVTLDAAPAADELVEVWDATGHAAANPISFDGAGNTIAGSATLASFIAIDFGHARLIWDGTQWLLQ